MNQILVLYDSRSGNVAKMAALVAEGKSEEEVAAFQKRAQGAAKKILANFGDYECYVGESMDPEGM